jgi:hypothetical protein
MCNYLTEQILFPYKNQKYFYCELTALSSKELTGTEERLRINQKTLKTLCEKPQEHASKSCPIYKKFKHMTNNY